MHSPLAQPEVRHGTFHRQNRSGGKESKAACSPTEMLHALGEQVRGQRCSVRLIRGD